MHETTVSSASDSYGIGYTVSQPLNDGLKMIVNTKDKYIVATAPRAATMTVHHSLAKLAGARWVVGVNADSWADHHTTRIPHEWKTYRRVMVVRNPYTRLLSLSDDYNRKRVSQGLKPWHFHEFIGEYKRLGWFYSFTQKQWAAGLEPAEIIRVETLQQDIKRVLGKGVKISPAKTNRKAWREHYRNIKYSVLVDLYQELLPDLTMGYINDAITPNQASIFGGINF